MRCQWCGREFWESGRWTIDGKGTFCSEKCCDEWKWEHGGGKERAEFDRQMQEFHQEREQRDKIQEQSKETEVDEIKRNAEAEKDHFRPFIEKRIGRPLRLDEIWWNERMKTWGAKEEILAEASTAMKKLEAESGVRITTIPGVMDDFKQGFFTWFSNQKRWGFRVPRQLERSSFVFSHIVDGSSSYANHPDYLRVEHIKQGFNNFYNYYGRPFVNFHWVNANDLAPLIAVAAYEQRSIQDLNLQAGREYDFVPEISCVVSKKEIEDALQRQYKGKDNPNIWFIFSKEENKFYYDGSDYKKPDIFHKNGHSVPYHLEVSLSALEICIPVKKIAPSAQPDDVFDDDFDFEEDEEAAPTPDDLIKEANQFHKAGNVDGAIEKAKQALAADPNHIMALNCLGFCLIRKRKHNEAIPYLDKAIGLNPADDIAYNNRGECYYKKGGYEQAAADFKKAVELKPGDRSYKDNLAKAEDKLLPEFCEKCGTKRTPGEIFCSKCGTKAGVPLPKADPEPPPKPALAFCEKCGAKLDPGVLFCEKCGTKIGG